MKFYFAPLVGVTGHVYRKAHHMVFPQVDKYFTPFVSPTANGIVKQKELQDVLPENNASIPVVPQILTNDATFFIATAKQLKEFGYKEVNLNLGCPSGPVVSRGRGSGFLAKPNELDAFLEEIFAADLMKISIKTRIGKDSPEEIYRLMEIYNKYPLEDLIIHPRIQKDFYKNTPNRPVFYEVAKISKNPICYNGDIYTKEEYEALKEECPSLRCVMFGRGLLHNPALVREILTGEKATKEEIKSLHDIVFERYVSIYPLEDGILARMKQFWFYVNGLFAEHETIWSKVKDCKTLAEYGKITEELFCMD